MYRITTESGRVGHIAGSIADRAEGRVITTACGKTYPEADLRVVDDLDDCTACDKKFYNLLDDVSDTFATEKEADKANEKAVEAAENEGLATPKN